MKTKVTFKGTVFCHYSDKDIEKEYIVEKELGDKMKAYCKKKSWNWYKFDDAFPDYLDELKSLACLILAVDYYENVRGYYVDDPEEMGSEKVKSMSLEERLEYYRSVVPRESKHGTRWDEELGDFDAGVPFSFDPPLFEDIEDNQAEDVK